MLLPGKEFGMVDHNKMKEMDSHWKEVMNLAEKYGFIGQAVEGNQGKRS